MDILANSDLFTEDLNYTYWDASVAMGNGGLGFVKGKRFFLKETHFAYEATNNFWQAQTKNGRFAIDFERIFNEIINNGNISDRMKELILFNLVDLKNLGR